MATCIVRKVLHHKAADQVRGMIQADGPQVGQWIGEIRLIRAAGISRSRLREALQQLADNGRS